MNPINLISSTLALGAMIGISGSHYKQVQMMVENASQVSLMATDSSVASAPVYEVKPSTQPSYMMKGATAERRAAVAPQQSGTSKPKLVNTRPRTATDQRDAAMMEILLAIRSEQKNLRIQLGDTNRNVDELAFRVDSYSTQFRPLQSEIGTPRARVVPEDEFVAPFSGQLLPPKQ